MTDIKSRLKRAMNVILSDIDIQIINAKDDLNNDRGLNIEDFIYDVEQALLALTNLDQFIEMIDKGEIK